MKTKEEIDLITTAGLLSILEQLRYNDSDDMEMRREHKATLRRIEVISFISERISEAVCVRDFIRAARLQEIYNFYAAQDFTLQSGPGRSLFVRPACFLENYFLQIYLLLIDFEKGVVLDTENEIPLDWEEQHCAHLHFLLSIFMLDEVICSWNKRQALKADYIKVLKEHEKIEKIIFSPEDFSVRLGLLQAHGAEPLMMIFDGWDYSSDTIRAAYDLFCESGLQGTVAIKIRNEPEATVTVLYRGSIQ